mgnify:CR=1 FL=1
MSLAFAAAETNALTLLDGILINGDASDGADASRPRAVVVEGQIVLGAQRRNGTVSRDNDEFLQQGAGTMYTPQQRWREPGWRSEQWP